MGNDFLRLRMSSAAALPVALVPPDAQQVVAQLEADAQRFPKCAERGGTPCVSAGHPRAGPAGIRADRGRLAANHPQVLVGADIVAFFKAEIQRLALDDAQRGQVQRRGEFDRRGGRHGQFGQPVERDMRQREKRVAGVDRLCHSPERPDGWAMPT